MGIKFLLLLVLMALLSYVHFSLQPQLDGLFAQAPGQAGVSSDPVSALFAWYAYRSRIPYGWI